tara:strand:- start:180 stop:761 length:582 start_codon:yes stop_codon:yes gene_type:complete
MLFCAHDLSVEYIPQFFNKEKSNFFLNTFTSSIKWRGDQIKIYGKTHPLPRLTAFFGDLDASYSYSGISMNPMPWTKELLEIKSKIEYHTGNYFNSVLLNRYRDGCDYHGFHSDNESSLGNTINIASVSFGSVRDFKFKTRDNSHIRSFTFPLSHGSLLLMNHPTQIRWLHSLPKRLKVRNERINLTFRYIVK